MVDQTAQIGSNGQPYLAPGTTSMSSKSFFALYLPNSNYFLVISNLNSLQFVPMLGSDVLVVAKNPSTGQIMKQILNFCGNGQLELNEECEGVGNFCANCKCTNGLIGYNGRCGLPNVIPVLDCVETVPTGNKLHFSFINEDGIEHTLPYGYMNSFSPSPYGVSLRCARF